MVTSMYQHINGHLQTNPMTMTIEAMFAWNIRFEVITQTEEEFDYLYGLQLMFGRELEMKTWAEWKEEFDASPQFRKKKPLPFTFTTFHMYFSELR